MKNKVINFLKDKEKCLLLLIFILAFFIRVFAINQFPIGLNCDEASSGYEAYAILKRGIDRNGNFLPVFLESWGSGQNVLYSYLVIPFVLVLGLNIVSTRLPMAIVGCISLIVWYKLMKQLNSNRKFYFIGLAFLCICPWHIMKSRWGLESNLFPDLVLWAVYFVIKFLKTKKSSRLYIAFAILGITGYSYGTSYLFLPIFCICLYVYLWLKKKISIKEILISALIIFVIALPIMLYVVINTFDLPQINLPFMTIPRLGMNRYEEQTTLFRGNILFNAFYNIKNSISLIFLQNDRLAWNSIPGIGMYYIVSVPFLILGIIFAFRNSKYKLEFDSIMNIWFASAVLLLFVFVDANINRINVLIFPLIYYCIKGIYIFFENISNISKIFVAVLFMLQFIFFTYTYCNMDPNDYWTFTNGIEEAIQYVNSLENVENIYCEYCFKEPYIYVLFYTQYDVKEYVNTVKFFRENGTFDNVESFGKYHFTKEIELDENEKNVYVLSKNSRYKINEDKWDIRDIDNLIVVRGRKN